MNATTLRRLAAALLVAAATAATAHADGMIVPTRPEIRVRGHWAVKYHHVNIRVRDQVAFVEIDQEFVNTGKGAIEVEYLFPVPPGAAIDGMTLVVNGKEFAARMLKADEARKIYEDIVRKKKDPALLEYAGFGLYKTRAFPLEPGKPARVVVKYKNVCKRDQSLTEVWYPLNTEKFSARPIDDVEVKVDIQARSDITGVYSPTHPLTETVKGPRHRVVVYRAKKTLPIADFQAFYKTTDKDIGATLLTHQPYGDRDGYFMLLVSPNPRAGKKKIVPKDVVVVLDHSGSMGGKKIDQAKTAVQYILKRLNSEDRFNVIAYSDGVDKAFEGLPAVSDDRVANAVDWVDRIESAGGTNIHDALVTAMTALGDAKKPGRPGYVIFLTDGLPTIGKTNEKDILAGAKAANRSGARLFAFGVGYDVNVRLLDRLVGDNHGRSNYVRPNEPVEAKITALYTKIRNPVMTNLQLSVARLRLRDMYPRELGDLFDGDQIVVVGRYDSRDAAALPGKGAKRKAIVTIKGVYDSAERAFEYPVTVNAAGRDMRFEFVEKLWAIRRVGFLLDKIQLHGESKELTDELIRLAKEYGIMTPYTSFLADETVELSKKAALAFGAGKATRGLRAYKGGKGQLAADNRSQVNNNDKIQSALSGPAPGVRVLGNSSLENYEGRKRETVTNVRQVGNQAVYRRGRTWIANNASDVDLKKDLAKIRDIVRFSQAYFALVKDNTVADNQLMATQRTGEELVLRLRGQVYRIK